MDSSDGQAGSSEASSDNFLPEADEIIEASWSASEPGKQSREESDNDALNSVDDEDDEEQGNYGVSAYGMSAASGTNASGSKRGLPKLREILRRQKQDSEDEDTPDIEYVYEDEDCFGAEMAELYSYTEGPEFQLAQSAFEETAKNSKEMPKTWNTMTTEQRCSMIQTLLDRTEVASRDDRLTALRGLLYICQGCWLECQSDSECLEKCKENVVLLYHQGVFSSAVELLSIEMEDTFAANSACRKLAVSLADSVSLRTLLSLLYTMTQVLRSHKDQQLKETFINDLNTPVDGDELFAIKLMSMVTRFCSGAAPHFPMKKVLLLLWKVLLTSLGGMEVLRKLKADKRSEAGLSDIKEDTLTVSKTMRAASPPASAADILEATNNRRNNRPSMKRMAMAKQNSLDDYQPDLDDGDDDFEDTPDQSGNLEEGFGRDSPRPGTPVAVEEKVSRSLPWTPKVRQKDLDSFLDYTRMKFVGFTLKDDRTTLAGLPNPIHEGVRVLNSHMYRSLAELQIELEDEITNNPLSKPEGDVAQTSAEALYATMLPSLPQYMIALLKILLAAAPTSKAKTDSINIVTDVLPQDMPMTVMQSMKLGIDINRHKEIIVKAVSAILLLLLKHFKVNHVYQFEFMSQHLVFANCIPLVLKFFNQNIMAHIASKNNIALLDFPSCVIGEQPELTAETLEIGDTTPFCWRNIFSCINLLRVLNKLTKWKQSRIMMLVVFKSAPILKRALKVKHAMLQLYVLKLLKMQTKYLGRQWRKSNMKTMSAIYTKVRHRLNDDWAYGNDVDSRPWDYQAEECSLRSAVDRFNHRRYQRELPNIQGQQQQTSQQMQQSQEKSIENQVFGQEESDFDPVDNCLASVLGQDVELTDEFKANYQTWLQREVYNTEIQWELLLEDVENPKSQFTI